MVGLGHEPDAVIEKGLEHACHTFVFDRAVQPPRGLGDAGRDGYAEAPSI
jgi:hypothetical protein